MAQPGHIAFLGFGEAARAFRETLAEADPALKFSAYDIKLDGLDTDGMRGAMETDGVAVCETAADLCEAEWIFSAVTADQSLQAVQPLLPSLGPRRLVIDINSVSPDRKRKTAGTVLATGADYLDMAVMSPVDPKGHRAPVLLAGESIDAVAGDIERLGFDFRVVGNEPGTAAAIKMVRSVFVKGLEAITVETLLAAQASGCLDEIQSSLSKSFPGLGWPEIAEYQFERTLCHGLRRAAEMEESATTLDTLGLNGGLAREIAEVQRAQGRAGGAGAHRGGLPEMLAKNLAARMKEQSPSE